MFESLTALRCRLLVSRDKAARLAVCLVPLLLAALGLASSASAAERTTTFTTAGAHSFTVPAGVTSLRLELQGGAGGICELQPGETREPSVQGGDGARLGGAVSVFPGETLSIGVAGEGGNCQQFVAAGKGGSGGGGTGGSAWAEPGAGGGGASSVTASDSPPGYPSLLAVAAGGGGATLFQNGGNASEAAPNSFEEGNGRCAEEQGEPEFVLGGQPGDEVEGGAGGTGTCATPGEAGKAFAGGWGGSPLNGAFGGGGGGGGYFGGGGGAGTPEGQPDTGGGGGSSFLSPSVSEPSTPTPHAGPAFVG
jgi:hypothetical protein